MRKYILVLLVLVPCVSGCGRVRAYHEAADNLRAVIEVEGLDSVPEPHKSALQNWAEKRDEFWKIPNQVIATLRYVRSVAGKMGIVPSLGK